MDLFKYIAVSQFFAHSMTSEQAVQMFDVLGSCYSWEAVEHILGHGVVVWKPFEDCSPEEVFHWIEGLYNQLNTLLGE